MHQGRAVPNGKLTHDHELAPLTTISTPGGGNLAPSTLPQHANGTAGGREGAPLVGREEGEWKQEVQVAYMVDETPTFAICLLLGFQVGNRPEALVAKCFANLN